MNETQIPTDMLVSPIVTPAKVKVTPPATFSQSQENEFEVKQVVKPAVCQAKVSYVRYDQKSERDFYGNMLQKQKPQ